MKIACTVSEFADIVRGCHDAAKNGLCLKCPIHCACSGCGIEQFVSAHDVFDDAEGNDAAD